MGPTSHLLNQPKIKTTLKSAVLVSSILCLSCVHRHAMATPTGRPFPLVIELRMASYFLRLRLSMWWNVLPP